MINIMKVSEVLLKANIDHEIINGEIIAKAKKLSTPASRKKAAKKMKKWLRTPAGKKYLRKQEKRKDKIEKGTIKIDREKSRNLKKANKRLGKGKKSKK